MKKKTKTLVYCLIECAAIIALLILSRRFRMHDIPGWKLVMIEEYIKIYVAPAVLILYAVINPIVSLPMYSKIRQQAERWDRNDMQEKKELLLNLRKAETFSPAFYILEYIPLFFIVLNPYRQLSFFTTEERMITFITALIALVAITIGDRAINLKYKEVYRIINPRTAEPDYSEKANIIWLKECENNPGMQFGKASHEALIKTNRLCKILVIGMGFISFFFEINILAPISLCVVAAAMNYRFTKETIRLLSYDYSSLPDPRKDSATDADSADETKSEE